MLGFGEEEGGGEGEGEGAMGGWDGESVGEDWKDGIWVEGDMGRGYEGKEKRRKGEERSSRRTLTVWPAWRRATAVLRPAIPAPAMRIVKGMMLVVVGIQ